MRQVKKAVDIRRMSAMWKYVVIAVLVVTLLVAMAAMCGCKSKSGEEIQKQIQEERGLAPGTVPPPPPPPPDRPDADKPAADKPDADKPAADKPASDTP
jgi:hypothetical protein